MSDRETIYANNLFEQPWWLDIVAEGSWDEVIVEEKGKIIGRFPFFIDNGNIKMPTLTQTCGIWLDEGDSKSGNENLSQRKKIIDKLLEQLPSCKNIRVALDTSMDYILPFLWKGFVVSPRVSYRIEDLSDLDSVYANFGKTVKKNIKSAQKKVEISTETDVDVLLEIMDKTFAAQGRKYPISKDCIRKIVSKCDERGNGIMYTARDADGNVHACSYFVYDKNVFYYLIAGSDNEYRSSGAQTLILWKAIQYAAQVSKAFDFEGSMVEGIENFFRRFGGKPITYYEIRKEGIAHQFFEVLKPRIKKVLGYKA